MSRAISCSIAFAVLLGATEASASMMYTSAVNLGAPINTIYHEGEPCLSSDSLTLYFESNRPGGQGPRSIWQATRASVLDSFGTPTLVPGIDSTAADFGPAVSSDELTLYFGSSRNSPTAGNIWQATRASVNDPFGNVMLVAHVNTAADDSPQDISADGLTLYFSSIRSGGEGSRDLWQATRASIHDEFGNVTNLGSSANSPQLDVSPSISADGLELYFASGRAGGYGSRSLWMATRASTANSFGAPTVLPEVVNSSAFENAPDVSSDGTQILFASNRSGGEGGDDIWMTATVPEPSTILLLLVAVLALSIFTWKWHPSKAV